jgi:vacuolar protein sorting-associated protein 41
MIYGKIFSDTQRHAHVCHIMFYSVITRCSSVITYTAFIRGLLENVGAEIDPIRLIRRIKNGLEIPGLQPALIKILHDFNLQISLLEGARAVLDSDASELARALHKAQTAGFFLTGQFLLLQFLYFCIKYLFALVKTPCPICNLPLHDLPSSVVLLYLCRHAVHARCAASISSSGNTDPTSPRLPVPLNPTGPLSIGSSSARSVSNKIA